MADPPKAKGFWRDLAIFRIAKNGGEAEIRTLGPLRDNGFQDRRFQPLSHLSEEIFRRKNIYL